MFHNNRTDHIAFQVSNLDRAIEFYTDKLGLKLLFKEIDELHKESFAFFELEGCKLELLEVWSDTPFNETDASKELSKSFCPHLAIGCENLDQTVEHLNANAIEIVKGPLEISGTVKWLYCIDPDNNIIEFVEWISSADESNCN